MNTSCGNMGMCDKCRKTVPISHHQKDNKEYLHKNCPDCGVSISLISNDAAQYRRKREFMADCQYEGCDLACLDCNHKTPNLVFIETTNRCNMNCPICLTNVPAMGFQFEPNMKFFDKIFKYCSELEFPPSIQLFGGEPTVREDMFDIIALAKSYGLIVRIATNGLKIADEAYAKKIIESGATVLFAFDGYNEKMYSELRAHPEALEVKLRALDNLSGHNNGKVVLMSVVDKQINGNEISKFINFCKDKPHIRGIYFMPLAHVWSDERLDYQPERTTQEDIEHFIDNCVEGEVEFVPMGSLNFNNIVKICGQDVVTFAGVHANCESFTYLVPQEDKFVSVDHFLRHGFGAAIQEIRALDKKVAPYTKKPIKAWTKFWVNMQLWSIYLKHLDLNKIIGAKGIRAFLKWMRLIGKLIIGKSLLDVVRQETVLKHANIVLEIIVLPFEDDYTLESERLRYCSSCFCYVDPKTDKVRSIPYCIWEKFKTVVMKDIALKYNKEGYRLEAELQKELTTPEEKSCEGMAVN